MTSWKISAANSLNINENEISQNSRLGDGLFWELCLIGDR